MKAILITTVLFLSCVSFGDGNCTLAIEHYKQLGRDFAKYLLHAKPNEPDYEKKVRFFSESIERWSKDYCYCKNKIRVQVVSPRPADDQ